MPFIPITHPFFSDAYGDLRPTLDSILGDGRREMLREPDSISLYPARHMMPEDEANLDALTLLGFSVAVGDGVPLDRQDVHGLVALMERPENFGDNFLGVTSADFGLKFTKGTNSLDVIFDLVVPAVTLAARHTRHDDRRAASPDLMAEACSLAETYLFKDQNLQRKIEIFRSSNNAPGTYFRKSNTTP
jgi:hypothetical protein